MRIIGGLYKGFRFDPPPELLARPTTDRAKESLINILLSNYSPVNKNCLDLFSGTGNIAFELASQGARSITAIDINFSSVSFITLTFKKLKFQNFKILKTDVFKWLSQNQNNYYDIIFADPPYDLIKIPLLPDLILNSNLLAEGGILIIEHRSSFFYQNPYLISQRDYGQSRFSFFSK